MTKTHHQFKSIDPRVQNADTIFEYVGGALIYQYMFDRRTTPWEKALWKDEELQSLEIDLEAVDRLYYIYHLDTEVNGETFQLAVRMDYKGKKVYIDLCASCDFTGFNCQGDGFIFVSGDANLFMKVILTEESQNDLIYQSLAEDGIQIEEQTEYDTRSRIKWTNAPMLKFLCHMAVYDNRKSLENYTEVLPYTLRESVDDFIRTREAKESYDRWDD